MGSKSNFNINVVIPYLWENTVIGLRVSLIDKYDNKIDSIKFVETKKNESSY